MDVYIFSPALEAGAAVTTTVLQWRPAACSQWSAAAASRWRGVQVWDRCTGVLQVERCEQKPVKVCSRIPDCSSQPSTRCSQQPSLQCGQQETCSQVPVQRPHQVCL